MTVAPGRSQPDWNTLDEAGLDEAIDKQLAQRQQRARDALSSAIAPAAWLVAAPFTTPALASASGQQGLISALGTLQEQGLVTAGGAPTMTSGQVQGDVVVTMTGAGRTAVLDYYAQRTGGMRQLRAAVQESAVAMASAPSLPPPVQRWTELARYAARSTELTAALDDRVDLAFKKRDAAELLNWIDTARPLADLLARDLDDSLQVALERAGRRLELLHRRAADERHLNAFLPRKEQIDALRRFVRGPDSLWALHLFGVGGVGKTMLLRYLTGRLADEFRAATARIDFDYLNPDYPRLDPGLLLWSFAQELRAHDTTGRAAEKFDAADNKLQRLRLELTSVRGNAPNVRSTDHPLFVDAVVNFVDGLQLLSRRVILIVDTCEELAKMQPDGRTPENVQETFRILRALHDGPGALHSEEPTGGGVASLRVVFAGRRPLASVGHDWTCPTSSQPPRPYLQLEELRGFTHAEAEEYLVRLMNVPSGLVLPIIERSPDVGAPAVIEWNETSRRAAEVPRCNPYDLRLYADWAREVPPPSDETIRASTAAQYVELRILRRLESYEPLRRLMPVVGLLKYVDQDIVRAALGDDDAAEQAYERLRNQEWIDERRMSAPDGSSARSVLSVEEGLRRRLWEYFRERGGVDARMLRPVADHLEKTTQSADLGQLDWVVFDAAIRALGSEPARAAAWWTAVQQRMIDERGYDWLLQVTGSLLAEQHAAARRPKGTEAGPRTIRAAVAAAYLSALAHTGKARTTDVTWKDVLEGAAEFPTDAGRGLLDWRSRCGLLVAAASSPSADITGVRAAAEWLLDAPALEGLSRVEWSQVLASMVAAYEALIEYVEGNGGIDSDAGRQLVPMLRASARPVVLAGLKAGDTVPGDDTQSKAMNGLLAFACALEMRTRALMREDAVASWADLGLSFARASQEGGDRTTWWDWVPPDHLSARIRLEYMRVMYPAYEGPQAVLAKVGPPVTPADVDNDRMTAMMLTLRSAATTYPIDDGGAGAPAGPNWASPLQVTSVPRCQAHRRVPPLMVLVGRELAAAGQIGRGISLLKGILRDVSDGDLDVLAHRDRALASLILRMRLLEQDERIPTSLSESRNPEDRAFAWAASARRGDRAQTPIKVPPFVSGNVDRAAWLHAIWQAMPALDVDSARDAFAWAKGNLDCDVPGDSAIAAFYRTALALDRLEALFVGQEKHDQPTTQGDGSFSADEYWQRYPLEPERALALALREAALTSGPFDERARAMRESAERLGFRCAATIALDLGDQLMVRLPDRAAPLFAQARGWFEQSEDLVGTFVAALRSAIVAAPGLDAAFAAAIGRASDSYDRLVTPLRLPPNGGLGATPLRVEETPREWQPLLLRLQACRAPDVSVGREDFARMLSADADWVIFSRRTGTQRSVKAAPPAAVERPAAAPASVGAPRRTLTTILNIAQGIASFAIGLGILIFVAGGAFRLFVAGTARVYPGEMTFGVQMIAFVAFIAAASLVVTNGNRLVRRRWASLIRAALTIQPLESTEGYQSRAIDQKVRMTMQARVPRAMLRWPFARLETLPPVEAEGRTGALVPYEALAAVVPVTVAQALRDLPGTYISQPTRVEIAAPPELQGPNWEAMLQLAAATAERRISFRCSRVTPPSPGSPARASGEAREGPPRGPNSVITVAAGYAQAIAASGWAPLGGFLRRYRWSAPQTESTMPGVRVPAGVVHLVGRPDEDVSGLVLRIGARDSTPAVSSQRRVASEAPRPGGDQRIRATDVADRFPVADLVVLQPEPAASWPEQRVASDREDAIRMRLFAADLTSRGVAHVLVLPRLDAAFAATALQIVARMLARHGIPDLETLVACASQIQRAVVSHEGDRAVAVEVALDVTICASGGIQTEMERS